MTDLLSTKENISARKTDLFALFSGLLQRIKQVGNTSDQLDRKLNKSLSQTFANLSAQVGRIEQIGQAAQQLAAPGIAFEQSMADLSVRTGIAGKELEVLAAQARKTGVESGLGALEAVKAYKTLASQLQVTEIDIAGLNTLQEKTITLAKASGMDTEQAALALTEVIHQFGLEATEGERVINVLAAASRSGAAEVPALAQSFRVAGAAARAAGLSVETTAGALEVMSETGLQGAEAGEVFRDMMQQMQSALGVDFRKTSLTEALEGLKPQMKDAAYLSSVFGQENGKVVEYLVSNSAAVQEMIGRVTDSNAAQEQADIRSQTVADRMAVLRERAENFKLTMFDLTGGLIGYVGLAGEMAGGIGNLIPLLTSLGNVISYVTELQNIFTACNKISRGVTLVCAAAQWVWNAALAANPIIWIVTGIIALITLIAVVCSKISGWGTLWKGIVGFMKYSFMAFIEGSRLKWLMFSAGFMIRINELLKCWYKFKNAVGLGSEEENNAALARLDADTEARKQAVKESAQKMLEYGKKSVESLGSIKMGWKSSDEKETKKATPGIAPVKVAGADNATLVPKNQTTSPGVAQQSSESAVTGGTKSTNITINLGKFMDNVNIYAQEFREGLNDLDSKVLESLTRVLTIAQSSAV